MTTYSFRDLTGAFFHPLTGPFIISGGQEGGIGQITITMTTDRTDQKVAADGNVMVSYVAGDNGEATLEIQQTSSMHTFLLNWFNQVKTAADNGDVVDWAAATLSLRNILDGSVHTLTGLSPSKVPDKTYASQGGMITWRLMAANIIND